MKKMGLTTSVVVKKTLCFILFAFGLGISSIGHTQNYQQYPGVIQVHTNYGSGRYSVEELAELAQRHGLKVLVLTSQVLQKAEYGFWPLAHLVGKSIERPSVLKLGPERYLKEVEAVNARYPDLVILPGLECNPFYYWTGSPFSHNLVNHAWQRQLLLVGLKQPEDIERLPVLGNRGGYRYSWKSVPLLWPLAGFLMSWWLWRRRKIQKVRVGQFVVSGSRRQIGLAIIAFLVSLVGFLNNYPFTTPCFDQYHGDQGVAPFQQVIDYTESKGAMAFWAQPDAHYSTQVNGVALITKSYPQFLAESDGYTGFTALYSDNTPSSDPGGMWDKILIQYCQGERERPVWAIAGASYHGTERGEQPIDTYQTIFLLPSLDQAEVLSALRTGRVYPTIGWRGNRLRLTEFRISSAGRSAEMGETLQVSEPSVVVHMGVEGTPLDAPVSIKVVRQGEVIKEFTGRTPLEVTFSDQYCGQVEHLAADSPIDMRKMVYYRLDIRRRGARILSNPIFIRCGDPKASATVKFSGSGSNI